MVSTEEIVRASELLSDISNVNLNDLLPHRDKLQDALRNLQRILDDAQCELPACHPIQLSTQSLNQPQKAVEDYQSSLNQTQAAVGDNQPSSTGTWKAAGDNQSSSKKTKKVAGGNPSSKNSVPATSKLLATLEDNKEKIIKYLSKEDSSYGGWEGEDWKKEDPRIVDLQIGKKSKDTWGTKVQKCLSRQSLVKEFTSWEEKTYRYSTVEERARELTDDCSKNNRSGGHITEFLELNKHRFLNQNTAMMGIKQGIRERSFTKYFGHEGMILVLAMAPRKFRGVKYSEFHVLKEQFRLSSWASVAARNTSSFQRRLRAYDDECQKWRELQRANSEVPINPRKRRRLDYTPNHRVRPTVEETLGEYIAGSSIDAPRAQHVIHAHRGGAQYRHTGASNGLGARVLSEGLEARRCNAATSVPRDAHPRQLSPDISSNSTAHEYLPSACGLRAELTDAFASIDSLNNIAMSDLVSGNDIPGPNSPDAWASGSFINNQTPPDLVTINDIPVPDAFAAWASETLRNNRASELIPMDDIPGPSAFDAWAAPEHLPNNQAPPDLVTIGDIPGPNTFDAWAAPEPFANSGTSSNALTVNNRLNSNTEDAGAVLNAAAENVCVQGNSGNGGADGRSPETIHINSQDGSADTYWTSNNQQSFSQSSCQRQIQPDCVSFGAPAFVSGAVQ